MALAKSGQVGKVMPFLPEDEDPTAQGGVSLPQQPGGDVMYEQTGDGAVLDGEPGSTAYEDPAAPIESGMPDLPAVPGVPPPPDAGVGPDPMEDASPAASGLPLSLPGSAGGSFALPGTTGSLPYMRGGGGGGGGRPPSRPSTPSPFNVGAGAPLAAPPSAAPPGAGGPGVGGGGASDDKIRAILSQFMRGRG